MAVLLRRLLVVAVRRTAVIPFRLLPEHDFISPKHIAEEVKPVPLDGKYLCVRFQRQFQFGEHLFRRPEKIAELVFVRGNDHDVVAIPGIVLEPGILDESVVARKVVVCQQLRNVVADWQSGRMGIYDEVEQVKNALILDLVPELLFQNVVVDALIVFPNIHFQDVDRNIRRVLREEPLDAFYTFMDAALLDSGIRVFDERLDKESPGHALYGVLHEVILVARIPVDDPELPAVESRELPITENAPPIFDKFSVELPDVVFEVFLEPKHLMVSSFVSPSFAVRLNKVFG